MENYRQIFVSFVNGVQLLATGNFQEFWDQFKIRCYSTSHSLGLRRNVTVPFRDPDARIDITIRLFNEDDIEPLLGAKDPKKLDSRLLKSQMNIVKANIPDCFVAANSNGKAMYMQWLIGPEQNQKIQETFKGLFPILNEDEALLEAAYMNPEFRGLGIMPAAMSRITQKAEDLRVKWAITFVDIRNIPSLKGCKRAGFSPYILRKVKWFLFKKTVSYSPIPEGILNHYHQVTETKANKKGPVVPESQVL